MDWLINFTRSESFGIIMFTMLFVNTCLLIYNIVKTVMLDKKYKQFMTRLGNGENFEEILSRYMKNVLNVVEETASLKKYCKEIEKNMKTFKKKYEETYSKRLF